MDVTLTGTGVEEYNNTLGAIQELYAANAIEATPGPHCPEQRNYVIIKRDRCDCCTACGVRRAATKTRRP